MKAKEVFLILNLDINKFYGLYSAYEFFTSEIKEAYHFETEEKAMKEIFSLDNGFGKLQEMKYFSIQKIYIQIQA